MQYRNHQKGPSGQGSAAPIGLAILAACWTSLASCQQPSGGGNGSHNDAGGSEAGGGGGGETAGAGGNGGGEENPGGTGAGGMAGAENGGAGGAGTAGARSGGSGGMPTNSPDAGVPDAGVLEEAHPPGYVRSIMAVGYGGIRLLSRNNGLTWTKVAQLGANGNDDPNLLVSVAWGKGLWIATFTWKTWTSPDGVTWTQIDPATGCRALVRVAYGNGTFVGTACNPTNDSTNTWLSTDGARWVKRGTIPAGFHANLLFAPAEGKFVAWGEDNHKVFTSTDGVAWTLVPNMTDAAVCDGMIRTAAACKNSFGGTGMWIRPGGTRLARSTDGSKFTDVYQDDAGNSVAGYFSLAWGWAAPQ